jgi:lysophospholipase L1-like esterase
MRMSTVARWAGVALAFVVATAACSSSPDESSASSSASVGGEDAAPTSISGGGTLLALGDSVPFGFRGAAAADEYRDATNFAGYPELVGEDLGLDVINATCPGETTASFLDVTAVSNGCENSRGSGSGFRGKFPLHVDYDAPDQSQLDFAVETLQRTDDVELVTVQIGANDAFICQSTTAGRCQSPAEYTVLGRTIQTNLAQILTTLRGEGGYDGRIVVVNYYAFDFHSPSAAVSSLLNGALAGVAAANGADVADAFSAFESAAALSGGNSVEAGLVLPNDVHPSEEGQRLLADAVESVVGG